jgi:hypothetical protein
MVYIFSERHKLFYRVFSLDETNDEGKSDVVKFLAAHEN